VVEGARRRHEVAEPLSEAIEQGLLDRADLLALTEAREIEAEPVIETSQAWHHYLLANAGGLAVAAGRLLAAPDPELFRPFGAAYGAAGLLRSVTAHARQGRCMLPADMLARHALTPDHVVANPQGAAVRTVIAALADDALASIRRHTRLPRHAVAAALPAVLARRDLSRAPVFPIHRGIGDRLAVTIAGLSGRI
jgi:phytoene synthase